MDWPIEELQEELFWEDVDTHVLGPDFEEIMEYENNILGDLPYTDEELVELFEDLNKNKKENRDNRKKFKHYKIFKTSTIISTRYSEYLVQCHQYCLRSDRK